IVDDIITITANAPYVIIQLENKKFVYHATLKSMEQMLDDQKFIRIHKSCIVNLSKVSSIKSRGNGDYDLEILDGGIVRLARTYVKSFKSKWFMC
ncbi:MAG: LytTR family transcriptional regulator, partial [Saprospiraceae bacterium]|nr:LytTR family transcriptional regulator [Saprospiraceae bacterium]